jgi:hypothetical protein
VNPYQSRERVIKGKVALPRRCDDGLVSTNAINTYVGGSQTLLILNLGVRWCEWLAAFTERFTSDKKKRYALNVGLGGPGIRSGPCGSSKSVLPLWNSK